MPSDPVNEYFRRFYPADAAEAWESDWCGGSIWRRYTGCRSATIFPPMRCKDGFSMSVQGHFGAYSMPRDDFAERYSSVEVFELSEPETLIDDGIQSPAGYVPVDVVAQVIAKHGGLVDAE